MATKAQGHRKDEAKSRQRLLKHTTEEFLRVQSQAGLKAFIQRTELDRGLLTPQDVLQLQHVVGNQTAHRMVALAGESAKGKSSQVIQRDYTDLSDGAGATDEFEVTNPGLSLFGSQGYYAFQQQPTDGGKKLFSKGYANCVGIAAWNDTWALVAHFLANAAAGAGKTLAGKMKEKGGTWTGVVTYGIIPDSAPDSSVERAKKAVSALSEILGLTNGGGGKYQVWVQDGKVGNSSK